MEAEEHSIDGYHLELGYCNKKELCALFDNMSYFYLTKIINEISSKLGKRVGTRYSPKQISIIILEYGLAGIVYRNVNKNKKH